MAGDPMAILGNVRRRTVLAIVSEADGPVTREHLAKRVTAAESEKSVAEVTAAESERTLIRLHHVDLPRLSAADLLSYDHDAGTVQCAELPLDGDEWLEMPVVEALEAWNGSR